MPITPLPPSNTKRYFLKYNNGHNDHTLMMRTLSTVDNTTAISILDDFLGAISDICWLSSIVGLEVALEGEDIRNSVLWTGRTTFGTGDVTDLTKATSYSFSGRSADGHKVRVYMFSVKNPSDDNYRWLTSELSTVDDVVTFLQAQDMGFLSISGVRATWKPYANVGWNDHWVKQVRKNG